MAERAEPAARRSFSGAAYARQPTVEGDETKPSLARQGAAAIDRILAAQDDGYSGLELAKQVVIELACLILPDRTVLEAAKLAEMKPGGVARAQLDHYLNGGGETLKVDVERFLREDPGVTGWVGEELYQSIAADNDARAKSRQPPQPVVRGRRAMGQEVYLNRDWGYAIGGCWWQWTIDRAAGVANVELFDRYRWYPHAHRATQCVHQAAERLKDHGAADYDVRGSLQIPLSSLRDYIVMARQAISLSQVDEALAEFRDPEPPFRAPPAPLRELPEEPPGAGPPPSSPPASVV